MYFYKCMVYFEYKSINEFQVNEIEEKMLQLLLMSISLSKRQWAKNLFSRVSLKNILLDLAKSEFVLTLLKNAFN